MDAEPRLTRRTLLGAGLAVVGTGGAAGMAGCSKSSTGKAGAGSGDRTGGSDSGAGGQVLVKVSDVPVGNAVATTLNGKPVLVSQPVSGDIVVFTAICTHMGCTVEPAGKQFHCPCHGSVYDAATGQVISGPAPAALAKIPSHLANGEVVAGA